MRRAQAIAPITSLQPPYSLIHREIEAEVLPFAAREHIGVIAYSPMASGLLTGAMTPERVARLPANDWRKRHPDFREGFQAEPFVLKNHEQVRVVLAEAHKTVFGSALEDKTSTGTADNRFFGLYAGIPALVYGPQSDDIHGFDERVNLESVRKITQATALFIAEWCGLSKA